MSAEAYLGRLADRGIEYVFANAGTDFAPIIEAATRNVGSGRKFPRLVTVPHENVAMAMAHGYYRVAGKPAAVMVHVTVGTGNSINGLMNAARDNIPMLLAAGRTPLTETGHIASRNRSIHWGQEAFDQGGMVREFVKWDYELRAGQPVDAVVDRALDIAMSEPRGPVYLTLPREVLASPMVAARRDTVRPLGSTPPAPSWSAIEEAASLIAKAEFPLIITSSAGRTRAAFDALAALAEEFALPVVQNEARDINLASDHPMNLGYRRRRRSLPKADVVLVIESSGAVDPEGRDAEARRQGDPHLAPIRSPSAIRSARWRPTCLITGEAAAALASLRTALREAMKGKAKAIEERRKMAAAAREDLEAKRQKLLETARNAMPIHSAWLARLRQRGEVRGRHRGERARRADRPARPHAATARFMGNMLSGGLGMGLGAALGAKLAAPEREVIVAVGDGSYMFGNPLPYHYVGARREPADAHHHRQQSFLARGAPVDARRLPERRRRQGQRHAADRAEARARLREGDRDLRRLRREGGGAGRSPAGAAPRHGEGARRQPALINVSTQGRHN